MEVSWVSLFFASFFCISPISCAVGAWKPDETHYKILIHDENVKVPKSESSIAPKQGDLLHFFFLSDLG